VPRVAASRAQAEGGRHEHAAAVAALRAARGVPRRRHQHGRAAAAMLLIDVAFDTDVTSILTQAMLVAFAGVATLVAWTYRKE